MGLNLMKVAVVKTGEQVVLYLHIQASCEPEHEPVVRGNIVGGEDLVFEKVLVKLFMAVGSEMIDLARYHKAEREQINWNK